MDLLARGSAVTLLQLIIIFESITFGVFLLARSRRGPAGQTALAVLLVLLGLHVAADFSQETGIVAEGLTIAHLSGLLYGPLFGFFVRGIAGTSHETRLRDLLQAMPYVVSLVLFFAGVLTPEALAYAVFLSLGIYLVKGMRSFAAYERVLRQTRSNIRRLPAALFRFAIFGMAILYVLDILSFLAGRTPEGEFAVILPVLVFGVLLVYISGFIAAAIDRERLFVTITAADRDTASVAVAPFSEAEREDLSRIEAILRERKLFLDPMLTLTQVADACGLPARRVSVLVNRGRDQNFAEWVNRYRVEEAQRLLATSGTDKSILAILYAAGFNSKSTFNTSFKHIAGMTPSEFRRDKSPPRLPAIP